MSKIPRQPAVFRECTGERTFFHGGNTAVAAIDPYLSGPDGELLCGSASPSVALRYGPVITCLTVNRWTTMSVSDFFANQISFEDIHASGIGAVIVEGDAKMFDFPVETVFILNPAAAVCTRSGTPETLGIELDALPRKEPEGPSEPGWELYVNSVFAGDLAEALTSLGWDVGPHRWQLTVPADGHTGAFAGVVTEGDHGKYHAENTDSSGVTSYPTLTEALVALDAARRSHLQRSISFAARARRLAEIDAYDQVHEDAEADYPL